MSVYRCYSEKRPGFDVEAQGLCRQLKEQLGVKGLESVRILNRYDADRIDPKVYEAAKSVVFSEPQVDVIYDETFPLPQQEHSILAVASNYYLGLYILSGRLHGTSGYSLHKLQRALHKYQRYRWNGKTPNRLLLPARVGDVG